MTYDVYVISFVTLCFLAYGFWGQRHQSSDQEVKLGWWRIAAGLCMSFVGGASTIAIGGLGYANGLIGFVDPLAVLLGGIIVIFLLRTENLPTTNEGISKFLAGGDQKQTLVYAICSLFVYGLLGAAQIVALQKIFTPFWGADLAMLTAIFIFAVICAYIFFGGIGAVTRTDVVQLAVVAVLFLLPVLWGIYDLAKETPEQVAVAQTPLDTRTILMLSIAFLFVPLSQDVWIRTRNAHSLASARIGILVGVAIYATIVGSAIFLGHTAAKHGVQVSDAETILPHFFSKELGVAGVLTSIVLLAAVMSTLDSFTFNLVSTISEDLWPKNASWKSASQKRLVAAAVIFLGCSSIALFAASILSLVLTALMIYVAVIGPGFLLRRYVQNKASLWIPASITLLLIMAIGLTNNQFPFEPYSYLVVHALLILAFIGAEKLRPSSRD